MSYQQSSYQFHTIGAWRTFHHRWLTSGRIIECDKCNSTVTKDAPHCKHWQTGATKRDCLRVNGVQREQLDMIDAKGVETFFLCSACNHDPNINYVLDAGMYVIPDLLRMLFLTAQQLKIAMSFYTHIRNTKELIFQSSELHILNHYDVRESVDIIFTMLLERILAHMEEADTKQFAVKRIRIDVKRIKGVAHQMSLPLKYRLKHATVDIEQPSNELDQITGAYRKYQKDPFVRLKTLKELKVNFYCLQMCRNTEELFVAPYYLSDEKNIKNSSVHSYIILDDIAGKFQRLLQINNIHRIMHIGVGDRIHTCSVCQKSFMETTLLALHRTLQCGRDFQTIPMPETVEIYEHCMKVHCVNTNCTLWGIWNE